MIFIEQTTLFVLMQAPMGLHYLRTCAQALLSASPQSYADEAGLHASTVLLIADRSASQVEQLMLPR